MFILVLKLGGGRTLQIAKNFGAFGAKMQRNSISPASSEKSPPTEFPMSSLCRPHEKLYRNLSVVHHYQPPETTTHYRSWGEIPHRPNAPSSAGLAIRHLAKTRVVAPVADPLLRPTACFRGDERPAGSAPITLKGPAPNPN